MIRIKFLAVVLFLFNLGVFAKETPKYVVSQIPAPLKENVNAVYWQNSMTFQIHSKSRATYRVYKAITILNQAAKDFTEVVVPYDKLIKVGSIKANVYDAEGKLVKKIKSSDIYDQSAYDGSLYSDNRFKYINLAHTTLPFTIEYEYELEFKSILFIPSFEVVEENIATMQADYTVIYPKDLKPRFRPTLINEPPNITPVDNANESTSWKFNNVKPIKDEPFSPPTSDIYPNIKCAPKVFEYDGFAGSMESWDDYAKWINTLNKGRDALPETTKQKILTLTKDLPSTEQKVKAIYEYMQNRTRYVSIQLGIGGYQPFEAKVVDETGYGDCKALSNYMVSMLNVAGIRAHYVLVNSGRTASKFLSDFPSSQFNHVIVCVPMEKDTTWLECTNQSIPYGYMGTHTGNRKALAITETGARVVSTPVYTERENIQRRTATVTISDDGQAQARVRTTYSGTQYETNGLVWALGDTHDEQKKWVQKNTDIPAFDIKSFSMSHVKAKIPSGVVNLDLHLNRFAAVSGKRLFVTPNLMNRMTYTPEKVEKRKTNVVLTSAFTDYDTINYVISEKLYPEFLPEPVKIESRFGSYESKFAIDQGKLVYTRRFTRKRGEHAPETYQEFIDFYKAINKADNVKIVFLNKT